MSERAETLAGQSFIAAEEKLHGLPFDDPRAAPPLVLTMSPAPLRNDPHREGSLATTTESINPSLERKNPTLLQALRALEDGTTTTRDLLESALAIAKDVAELGAVVACDEVAARVAADQLDSERRAGYLRGPLHGIPITVKDVIDVGGLPTRAGSAAYDDLPEHDAVPVARLRAAGALIFAKVATHEFALGVTTPQCRNPHDPTRISGGSSGGSAIAIATGIGLGSLGTDTRASLRVPAALCGVVGFRPSIGHVPTKGMVPLSWTVDLVGPIASTVEDTAYMFDALGDAPYLTRDLARAPGVIGVVDEVFADADPSVAKACEIAVSALSSAGWTIRSIKRPGIEELELANDLGLLITRAEAATFHRSRHTDLDRCIPEVRDQLRAALTISAVDYLDAQRQREILAKSVLASFADCDVIASPTVPVVAPPHADYERYLLRLSRYAIIWSLLGSPAVSVPCGTAEGDLPVGLQLTAAPQNDQVLVDSGMTLERQLAKLG